MSLLPFLLLFLFHICHSEQESLQISVESTGTYTDRDFQLEITINSQERMKLKLTKSETITSKARVLITGAAGIFSNFTTITHDFECFHDYHYNAAFLRFRDESLQGTFRRKGSEFFIQPNRAVKRRRRKRGVGGSYVATAVQHDLTALPADRLPKRFVQMTEEMRAYLTDSKAPKLEYVVEVLLFIDYSIYQNWLSISDSSQGDPHQQAVNSIRYYYTSVVNSMDLRYNSINESDFSIGIKLAGFVIATTSEAASWTHNYLLNEQRGVSVDSYKVLDDFPAWLDANSHKLPKFDNALIFTRLPLKAGFFLDGQPRFISGLANIGAVCTNMAISINRENAPFATTGTASHELAHNLGSLHDVKSKNNCDGKDQYIMSPAPSQLNADNFQNPFKFSPCSVDYMRQYLGALSLMKKNCLLQTSYNPTLNGVPVDKPVGQYLDIDRQCKFLLGAESFYCGGMVNDLKMCTSLVCYDPVEKLCISRTEFRAANGTTCGNKKWCHKGNCIHNDQAQIASDFCMSGNYKGPDFKCIVEISKNPSRCYDDYYEKLCCASCEFLKKTGIPCAYGDRMPDYCANIKASQCYSQDVRHQCCRTCEALEELEAPACKYGDKADWCAREHPSVCYRASETCCSLCHWSALPFEGCEYGDRLSYCKNVTKAECGRLSSECCVHCNEERVFLVETKQVGRKKPALDPPEMAPPVCPYGDSWCERLPPFACYDRNIYEGCTCFCDYLQSSPMKGCEYGDREMWCKMVKKENCLRVKDPKDCCYSCSAGYTSSSRSSNVEIVSYFCVAFIGHLFLFLHFFHF